jgi:hexosaminidase
MEPTDPWFHIGGDELNKNCWQENQNIRRWLSERNQDVRWLEEYFHSRVREAIRDMPHKTFIYWEESTSFAEKLNNSAVHIWRWPRFALCEDSINL